MPPHWQTTAVAKQASTFKLVTTCPLVRQPLQRAYSKQGPQIRKFAVCTHFGQHKQFLAHYCKRSVRAAEQMPSRGSEGPANHRSSRLGAARGNRTAGGFENTDAHSDAEEEAEEGNDLLEDDIEDDLLGDDGLDDMATKTLNYLEDDAFEDDFDEDQEQYLEDVTEPGYKTTLRSLLDDANVEPEDVEGSLDITVTGISIDSREVATGDIFVCIKGQKTDGHLYAAEAVEKGAAAVIAQQEVFVDSSATVVLVQDTTSILSSLAGSFHHHPSTKLAVIGITGTNGKTTTSYLVRGIYDAMGQSTGLLGTIAYYIDKKRLEASHTTPDAVKLQQLMATMVDSECVACVMEVSSHALALERTAAIDFDVAVFTNLTRDHMDFHATEDDYRAAKGKLFERMVDPARHRKVVNKDDPNWRYFASLGHPDVPVITYALEDDSADVWAIEAQLSLFETELLVKTPQGNIEISSGLLGRHNIYNTLAACAVGLAVEAPLEDIVRGLEDVEGVPGRMELIDEEQPFAVIVDYAHTPDALERLLKSVAECGAQRIITVVGCGGDRDRGKRPLMAKIAGDLSDITILTSDNPRTEDPRQIIDDMMVGLGRTLDEYLEVQETLHLVKGRRHPPLPNGHRLYVYDERGIAVRAAVAMGEEGDAVVIAGKGHETYQIIGTEKEYYDDREECREALHRVDELHAQGIDTSEIPWKLDEST